MIQKLPDQVVEEQQARSHLEKALTHLRSSLYGRGPVSHPSDVYIQYAIDELHKFIGVSDPES